MLELFGDGGTSFAPVPVGTPMDKVLEFQGGAFMGMGASDRWLGDHIASQWGRDAQLIFVDPWISIIDRRLHPPKPRYFLTGTIIHCVPQMVDAAAALEIGSQENFSFLLIGFVIAPPVVLPAMRGQASAVEIETIAQNTQAVIVSAYDQDGYVVWLRG